MSVLCAELVRKLFKVFCGKIVSYVIIETLGSQLLYVVQSCIEVLEVFERFFETLKFEIFAVTKRLLD